jgi:PEP-CTERM motif
MTVETSSTSTSQQGSLKRRAAYSIAASAAAFAATNQADATVVYSGLQNISIGTGFSQQIDLNGDSQNDAKFTNYVFGGGPYQGGTVDFFPGKFVGFTSGNAYITALTAGSTINSGTLGPSFFGSMAYGASNPNAQFNNVTDKYVGLSFPAGANLFYGWVRVDITNATNHFLIKDWAYENVSGTGILAGVPEPGTLGLLAAGALGISALRRRRVS